MKAALVTHLRQAAPVYADFPTPTAAEGQRLVQVTASSISHVTKSRASGAHYSSEGGLPFVAGIDGVGVCEDGQRVYFFLPEHPLGAMAEYCVLDEQFCLALPDALEDSHTAAMMIPAMSSWAALLERVQLRKDETVLINGATGISGRLAVQIAKYLGASKVIATGRHAASLEALRDLGADVTVSLTQDSNALQAALKQEFAQGVDVVLDYLWGESAEALIAAAARFGPDGVPVRYVQIGSVSGGNINLPSAALRSSALQMMGSGMGSVAMPRLLAVMAEVLAAAPAAGFQIATLNLPLAQVEQAWTMDDTRERIVLRP
ncbi:quinone oxidoreductase family protein [Celerinatantimonas yamalensis]|uniref:Zinc-binding alcohol dehydrogenase family protein n=1 Tax=Celerinatantimonas yamalensis TaxID=559956 RepID=A0ABW9GA09_9GAMM